MESQKLETLPHPLLMEHILQNIFRDSCLTKRDLLNFRQVCVTWNHEATKVYKTELKRNKNSEITLMKEAIALKENPHGNMPFISKLYLGNDFFQSDLHEVDPDPDFQPAFCKFLQLFGNEIELMDFRISICSRPLFEGKLYDAIQFNRLRILKFEVTLKEAHCTGRDYSLLSSILETIFQKSPNLQDICLGWTTLATVDYWPHLGNKVLPNIPQSVTNLEIYRLPLTADDCKIFGSLPLPNLTCFILNLCLKPNITGIDICQLLDSSQKCNMVDLDLTLTATRPVRLFRLPIFPNLLKLNLEVLIATPDEDYDMSFPTLFPKVTYFSLGYIEIDLLAALFPRGVKLPLVNNCKIEFDMVQAFPTDMVHLFYGFTGLKKLKIQVDNANDRITILWMIFVYIRHLEHFELELEDSLGRRETQNIDSVLTGLSVADVERLQTNPECLWTPDQPLTAGPGFAYLTNLKTLTIIANIPVNITDVTVRFGICQLPRLEKLVIDKFNLNEPCIQYLKSIFGPDVIRSKPDEVNTSTISTT